MAVFHLYCFKSVGIYKHKLSRIESLVIFIGDYTVCAIVKQHELVNCKQIRTK